MWANLYLPLCVLSKLVSLVIWINHNMVLGYDFSKQKKWQLLTNAPPLRAILMDMRMHRSNACGIIPWSTNRTTLDASGCSHWATTRPMYCIGGCLGDNQQTTMKKYAPLAGHFDGHCDAVAWYCAHHPMVEVQDFTGSHWMPPLGKHSLQ